MSEVIARLVVQQGPEPGTSFLLTADVIRIGRTAGNDIVISDPEMSRQHAQLVRQADNYAIQDLGSTNGTFVNYQRVTGLTLLSHGDVIAFGEAVTLAYWDESATDSQPVPPPVLHEQRPKAVPPPRQPAASSPPPVSFAEPAAEASPVQPPLTAEEYEARLAARRRRLLIGCGVSVLLLICLCVGSLFFLDGYQQGRLLYCGGLRPFWELVLGPFGFNPVCP
ncbi:MAG: FHA domain-containing protein [Ardenticatenaceae bacterium]|nr:FHA domain-containing protein [Ardenticatenaceae bacterium]MCB9446448.1 FHA domain-containing protein [Ardenticatenaceae bacterium]